MPRMTILNQGLLRSMHAHPSSHVRRFAMTTISSIGLSPSAAAPADPTPQPTIISATTAAMIDKTAPPRAQILRGRA